jgi:hypothetical protein
VTNRWLESRYVEQVRRAALAVEPIDYGRRSRIALPLDASLEGWPPPRIADAWTGELVADLVPRLRRHSTALRVLVHGNGVGTSVDVRIDDRARRYVPRRLRVTIPSSAVFDAAVDGAAVAEPALRLVRPVLFPGAAYDAPETATGIRGRVERDGVPMRWARVEATLPSGDVVGRAHGDDRGEFLLLLGTNPANLGTPALTLTLTVTVRGPSLKPVKAAGETDPLWDLPLEEIPSPAAAADILGGKEPPPDYKPATGVVASRDVEFTLGRLASEPDPFEPV